MGLVANIKIGFKILSLWKSIKEAKMTKGFKSTEFWVTVIGSLVTMAGAVADKLDPTVAAIVTAILGAAYSIARALAKKGEAEAEAKKS